MRELAGWGRYPVVRAEERVSEQLEQASRGAVLSRGLGRSYGDASLPPPGAVVVNSRLADRLLAFDPASGRLRAEAGFPLVELNRLFPARGWATPVSPGTQYVTLGGMVASDVHGKNHHVAGCFGEHVHALRMRVADGRVLEVTEANEPELFRATLGGMGLTGHLLEVEFTLERIPSPWIWCETEAVADLDALVDRLRAVSAQWPFTMSWVDSTRRGRGMGRGVLIYGRWAEPGDAPAAPPRFRERVAVPFELPGRLVNTWTVRIFNAVVYQVRRRWLQHGVVHPQPFFYPLDAIRHWNRLYGRRGFAQYQCVVPIDAAGNRARLVRFFETLTRLGGASPVSVIKDCGREGKGLLSFPRPGISVALDLPLRPGHTQALVDALNEAVIEAGGRIYLTKDSLTRAEHLRAMEPRLAAFDAVRRKWDPDGRIRSALSVRLLGDSPGDAR